MTTPAFITVLILLVASGSLLGAWLRVRRQCRLLTTELEFAQKRRQIDELELSERSALDSLKDEFVSTVSHELRTPLTSIRGALGLLSAGVMGTVDAKAQNLLRIALTNTDRLIRLINDILDLERMESGRAPLQVKRCSLADLIQQSLETMGPMADAANVRLTVDPEPETGDAGIYFDADSDRILQVLTNLLSNAIKFSPPGGRVGIEIEAPFDGLVVRVRDEGRGIPEDQLETIFERFKQIEEADARQRGGTGLGLAICRTIVQQHGGRIWAERNEGRGASLMMRLPRQQRATDQEATAPVAVAVTMESSFDSTILVCNEDVSVRRMVSGQLRGRGHRVLEAGTTEEAMKLSLEQPAEQPVQAILLDIPEPDAPGWESLKQLTHSPTTANIPLVMMSGMPPTQIQKLLEVPLPRERRGRRQANLPQGDGESGPGIEMGVRGGYVLLVEDDLDLASVVRQGFDKTEVKLDHAATRQQAMTLCEQRRPDLMILDLGLPDGDGFSLVEWLRGQSDLKTMPLVVYSSSEVSTAEKAKLRLGPTKFLTKAKVQTKDVEELVLMMVQRRRARRPTELKALVAEKRHLKSEVA